MYIPPTEALEVRSVLSFKQLPRHGINVSVEGIRSVGEGGNVRDGGCR